VRVLFVCLGNICRSPTAEALMRARLTESGLQGAVEVDSAGTGDWHVGEPPDPRATQAARARGVELESLARQVEPEDFREFDLILAMDTANLRALERVAPDVRGRRKLRLLREFEPRSLEPESGASRRPGDMDVPDPYYGGSDGFDRVLDILDACCAGLMQELRGSLTGSSGDGGGSGGAASGLHRARESRG
jgi:protein-tyrosine phosphatase